MFTNPSFPNEITEPYKDRRNVIDHYKNWTDDLIRQDLAYKAFPLVCVFENFAHDFNISTGLRNANGFGVSKVFIVGRKKYDSRGAVGVARYMDIEHRREVGLLYDDLRAQGYQIVAVDNIDGAEPLRGFEFEEKTCLIFGQESIGISNDSLSKADRAVEIEMFGSVRSLNVGTTTGIIMNAWCNQWTK